MKEQQKTKQHLIHELRLLRARIGELETSEAEHRLGAEELKRSKEFIETVMNSITDSVSIIDTRDFRVVGANRAFLETLAMDAEEVIGKPCYKVNHGLSEPCGPVDPLCPLLETVKTGVPSLVEHVHRDKDGNRVYVEISAHPVRNGKGEISQVVHVVRDITERRKAEDELRTLSRAVEQSPATVVITDPEGTIEYVNQKFVELTGYTVDEAIGENPRILKSGRQPPEFYEELWKTITQGKEWRGEFFNKKKNGDYYWEDASISPIRDQEGIITHFVGIKEDISERKLAQESLRESEEKYRALFNEARDGIVIINRQGGRIVDCNPEFENQTGRDVEQLRKMKIWEIRPPGKRGFAEKKFYEINEKGEGGSMELEFEKPDGTIVPVEFLSKAVRIRGEEYLQSIVRDISERKRAEETMAQLAYHDSLTGLPNRLLFKDRLTMALAQARRNRHQLAVMLLDLDHFKDVNDTLGHSVGDQLLQAVGRRLTGLLRKNDTVARMGGDEFLLLLPGIKGTGDAAKVAQKVVRALRKAHLVNGHKLHITASIGVALYPNDGEDDDSLLSHADNAMYWAKKEGRDTYRR